MFSVSVISVLYIFGLTISVAKKKEIAGGNKLVVFFLLNVVSALVGISSFLFTRFLNSGGFFGGFSDGASVTLNVLSAINMITVMMDAAAYFMLYRFLRDYLSSDNKHTLKNDYKENNYGTGEF